MSTHRTEHKATGESAESCSHFRLCLIKLTACTVGKKGISTGRGYLHIDFYLFTVVMMPLPNFYLVLKSPVSKYLKPRGIPGER